MRRKAIIGVCAVIGCAQPSIPTTDHHSDTHYVIPGWPEGDTIEGRLVIFIPSGKGNVKLVIRDDYRGGDILILNGEAHMRKDGVAALIEALEDIHKTMD